jgi:hypothetical protein
MIKIKWLDGRTAKTDGEGGWKSDNKIFENGLNLFASSENIKDYVPDIEQAMLKLAKEHYKGIEVIEQTKKKIQKVPKNAMF